jgi:predicted PhzF superfamily epimerase YddE/YHI9
MPLTLYHIDAFTDRLFGGNPAAVIPLSEWLPDPLLIAIAAENNLSETAFFIERDPQGGIPLRWFSPTQEVPLCGHATLATAFVILCLLYPDQGSVRFETLSGILEVDKTPANTLIMHLPRFDPTPPPPTPNELQAALPPHPQDLFVTPRDKNYYLVYDHADTVRSYQPDPGLLRRLAPYHVVITAPGDPQSQSDYVCRYFAPTAGIPEDPVTGSIQCVLVPYWAQRLHKTHLTCQQLSHRQGRLSVELQEHGIRIQGQAVLYCTGTLHL